MRRVGSIVKIKPLMVDYLKSATFCDLEQEFEIRRVIDGEYFHLRGVETNEKVLIGEDEEYNFTEEDFAD